MKKKVDYEEVRMWDNMKKEDKDSNMAAAIVAIFIFVSILTAFVIGVSY